MVGKKPQLDKLRVLLGVTGSVAACKAVELASLLTKNGCVVRTVMTESACEFVRPKSFESVTGEAVYTSMWTGPEDFKIGHISLSDWADVVVVAPATANIISKAAGGICDDLLSTTLCACWQKKMIFAPAMNTKMWQNPVIERNVKSLGEQGIEFAGPAVGRLACGVEGAGRMVEPVEIFKQIEQIAGHIKDKS